jgi:hypothetical protein
MRTGISPRFALNDSLRNNSNTLRRRLSLGENVFVATPRRSLHVSWRSSVRLALLVFEPTAVRQGLHTSARERV